MIAYYSELLTKGTVGAYIALGMLAFSLFIIVVQGLLGFSRGTSRSVMRLITVAISAILAFLGTIVIGRGVLGERTFASSFPVPGEALAPIAEAQLAEILLPFVFLVLFLLFSFLMLIPHKLLCGILGFSYKRNNLLTRIFGAVTGVVHGALTALILFFPVFCLMGQYVDAVKEPDASSAVVSFYETYVEDTAEGAMYKYPMQYGGNLLADEFSKANLSAIKDKK